MGITISYRGTIKDLALIEPFQQDMAEMCQSLSWKYHLWHEDQIRPFDAKLVHQNDRAEIKGHIPLRGISIHTHPENESLDLLFPPEGRLSSFMIEIMLHEGDIQLEHVWPWVKTQFGLVEAHIAIVKLLRYLKQTYIPDLEVIDDGDYWNTDDGEILMGKRAFLQSKMRQFEQALSEIKLPPDASEAELLVRLEAVFQKLMKKK